MRPNSTALKLSTKDFKLLKFLILRVILLLQKLYHKTVVLGLLEKLRIESVIAMLKIKGRPFEAALNRSLATIY
jgi:hypothetical protein